MYIDLTNLSTFALFISYFPLDNLYFFDYFKMLDHIYW